MRSGFSTRRRGRALATAVAASSALFAGACSLPGGPSLADDTAMVAGTDGLPGSTSSTSATTGPGSSSAAAEPERDPYAGTSVGDGRDGGAPTGESTVADAGATGDAGAIRGDATDATGDDGATTSAEPSDAAPSGEARESGEASEPSSASESTTPTRSGDGRARIGDPCPGRVGAQRPAPSGQILQCSDEESPRWTVAPMPGGDSAMGFDGAEATPEPAPAAP